MLIAPTWFSYTGVSVNVGNVLKIFNAVSAVRPARPSTKLTASLAISGPLCPKIAILVSFTTYCSVPIGSDTTRAATSPIVVPICEVNTDKLLETKLLLVVKSAFTLLINLLDKPILFFLLLSI